MPAQEGAEYINLVINALAEKAEQRIDALVKSMGSHPGQEEVSRYMQLKAYQEMTAEELAALLQQKGPDDFADYVVDMRSGLRGNGNGS